MKKIPYIFLLFLFIATFSAAGIAVNAQGDPTSFGGGIDQVETDIVDPDGGLSDKGAVDILKSVISFLLSLVAVLALAALIIGGIMYIVSLGDENRAKQAKQIIMYAIIGLLVVGMSFAIINTIKTLLID